MISTICHQIDICHQLLAHYNRKIEKKMANQKFGIIFVFVIAVATQSHSRHIRHGNVRLRSAEMDSSPNDDCTILTRNMEYTIDCPPDEINIVSMRSDKRTAPMTFTTRLRNPSSKDDHFTVMLETSMDDKDMDSMMMDHHMDYHLDNVDVDTRMRSTMPPDEEEDILGPYIMELDNMEELRRLSQRNGRMRSAMPIEVRDDYWRKYTLPIQSSSEEIFQLQETPTELLLQTIYNEPNVRSPEPNVRMRSMPFDGDVENDDPFLQIMMLKQQKDSHNQYLLDPKMRHAPLINPNEEHF